MSTTTSTCCSAIGNALHLIFGQMQLPMLIALGMVGYLAAVT